MNIQRFLIITFISIILLGFIQQSQATTVADFSKHAQYYNIKISPDGKHLAALMNLDGFKTLVFLETDTMKFTHTAKGGRKAQAAEYFWVNNERVVVQLQQTRGSLEKPLDFGEIYAVNYNGKRKKMVFGYRSKRGLVFSGNAGFILDMLPEDDKNILVYKQALTRRSDTYASIVKLNIYTGRESRLKIAPAPYTQFLTDNNSVPRFAVSTGKNSETKLFYSKGKGEKWTAFGKRFTGEFQPISFSTNNNKIYALKSKNGDVKGLYEYDLTTQEERFIFKSTIAEPSYVMKSDLNAIYALRLDEDYPKYIYLDKDAVETKQHKSLVAAFGGDNVEITSKTQDGSQIIVHVYGDRNPGAFYLFDTNTMSAKFLVSTHPWMKLKTLSPVEAFRIQTKDGLTLNGYITLPKKRKGKPKKSPTVIMPHGGPHARDYWGYNPQVQMLANAGYAVVQINFRGSTGYGKNFMEAGYGQWGTKIQEDILLATQYSIEQGIADKERLCIYGGSFGAYSALQSAILAPDLFKCVIGNAGIYDLTIMAEEGDIQRLKWGEAYLDKTLGTDLANLKQQSPVYHVDKLKAPVLIIHGEEDKRAPIIHAEKLRTALDKQSHPYEWLVKEKEGHGFYKESNILEANKKVLSFLKKHI